jgi:hypothetical protein
LILFAVALLRLCGGYRQRIPPEIEVFDLAHIGSLPLASMIARTIIGGDGRSVSTGTCREMAPQDPGAVLASSGACLKRSPSRPA